MGRLSVFIRVPPGPPCPNPVPETPNQVSPPSCSSLHPSRRPNLRAECADVRNHRETVVDTYVTGTSFTILRSFHFHQVGPRNQRPSRNLAISTPVVKSDVTRSLCPWPQVAAQLSSESQLRSHSALRVFPMAHQMQLALAGCHADPL